MTGQTLGMSNVSHPCASCLQQHVCNTTYCNCAGKGAASKRKAESEDEEDVKPKGRGRAKK